MLYLLTYSTADFTRDFVVEHALRELGDIFFSLLNGLEAGYATAVTLLDNSNG